MLPVLENKAVLEWCMKEGLIGSSYVCPRRGKSMELRERTVYVALNPIHHIWHYRVRLRESGQPIGRQCKTCKNAFPRTIPVSFGRLDTYIATESSLNVHFFKFAR
ncbi:hypothetical protein TNCV_3459971 [Trichonephila clavipes]|nr:hypothetical protein TNCV_3459971 [Trichonephila clavipes]